MQSEGGGGGPVGPSFGTSSIRGDPYNDPLIKAEAEKRLKD